MKGIPEYGFKCPKCGGVSGGVIWARIERSDSLYSWDADTKDFKYMLNSDHEVPGDSGWRCLACDAVIPDDQVRNCVVKLNITAEPVTLEEVKHG